METGRGDGFASGFRLYLSGHLATYVMVVVVVVVVMMMMMVMVVVVVVVVVRGGEGVCMMDACVAEVVMHESQKMVQLAITWSEGLMRA